LLSFYANDVYLTEAGGASLGRWLSIYDDVDKIDGNTEDEA